MNVYGYALSVDWSQGGTYTGPLEDLSGNGSPASGYVLPGTITITWGRDVTGEVTLAAPSGRMSFSLRNDTRLFNTENTSSPIAGKVLPNRRAKYEVLHQDVLYKLLDGVLDDTEAEGDPAGEFTASVLDGWGRPGAAKLSTPLYRGIRTGDAINIILDAIGWTGPRDIDPGATVMPWWWEDGTDARTAVDKLVASEGAPAIAYVRGGTFTFHDRHHRLFDARSVTSQGTFTHTIPAGALPGDFKIEAGSFRYNHGAQRIINSATISTGIRTSQPLAEVWNSDDPIVIGAGVTTTIVCRSTAPFHLAATPTISAPDGGGDIQVRTGAVTSATLSRTSGQSTILSITCSADTVITRLAVRALPVTVTRTVLVTATDQSSIGTFGTQELPDELQPVWANQYDAQAIATRTVAIYATYRPTIEFSVAALDDTYLTEILQAAVSDRITVRNDARGINGDFVIERLAHRITDMGNIHRLVVTCQAVEPTQPANVLTFDVAGKGFNQGAFGVDGIDSAASVLRFDVAGQGFNQGRFGT